MLLFKDILYDARVQREALALAEAGHKVNILCLKEFDKELKLHPNIQIIRFVISTKKAKQQMGEEIQTLEKKKSFKNMIVSFVRLPAVKILKDIYASKEFFDHCFTWLKKNNIKVDVIHSHDLNTLSAGVKLAKALHAKLIYDSHELYNEMAGRKQLDKNFGYYLENKLMAYVDHLIVVNPYVQDEFEKRYGKKPTVILQNTPIFNIDVPRDGLESFRERYNLNERDILLLYQGGVNPHRGIEETIRAIGLLPSEYKLIIMGNGMIKTELIKMVAVLGLNERVFFYDQVPAEDVLYYTKQAHIGLVMYRNTSKNNFYSTPNKIFEYMLAGIPAVASNHPGKSYIVEKEGTGICTEENPADIAEAVKKIIGNYDFYRSNCLANRMKYTWDTEKEKLINLYHSL